MKLRDLAARLRYWRGGMPQDTNEIQARRLRNARIGAEIEDLRARCDASLARLARLEAERPGGPAAPTRTPRAARRGKVDAAIEVLRTGYDATLARLARLEAEPAQKAEKFMQLMIEIAPGELIDRLSILEIKLERIQDAAKIKNIRHEYEVTLVERQKLGHSNPELERLAASLKEVNERIWDIEDAIRDLERARAFDDKFIAVARSVYQTNDKRAELKRQINELLNSKLIEEKSYSPY